MSFTVRTPKPIIPTLPNVTVIADDGEVRFESLITKTVIDAFEPTPVPHFKEPKKTNTTKGPK